MDEREVRPEHPGGDIRRFEDGVVGARPANRHKDRFHGGSLSEQGRILRSRKGEILTWINRDPRRKT